MKGRGNERTEEEVREGKYSKYKGNEGKGVGKGRERRDKECRE